MISIKKESDEENPRWFLPGQAKDGKSRDFHLATFLDAYFSQLLAEIGFLNHGIDLGFRAMKTKKVRWNPSMGALCEAVRS